MKKLDTSFITSTALQPIKQGTLDHLQSAYQEVADMIGNYLNINNYSPFTPYVLYGLEYSDNGTDWTITAGAIYYAHELFYVDQTTAAITGGQTQVLAIATTYLTALNADPTTFTDSTTHNVHQIRKITLANGVSGSTIADYADCVRLLSPQMYTHTEASANTTFTANFRTHETIVIPTAQSGASTVLAFNIDNPTIGAKFRYQANYTTGTIYITDTSDYNIYIMFNPDSFALNNAHTANGKAYLLEFTYEGLVGGVPTITAVLYQN